MTKLRRLLEISCLRKLLVKFSKFSTNRDISVLFEDLTSVEALPPMGGCMGGRVG